MGVVPLRSRDDRALIALLIGALVVGADMQLRAAVPIAQAKTNLQVGSTLRVGCPVENCRALKSP